MKTVVLLKGAGSEQVDALPQQLNAQPWSSGAMRIAVHLGMPSPAVPDGPSIAPVYDAIVEIWSDAPLQIDAVNLPGDWDILDVRVSQEVIGKPAERIAPVGITPGISQLTFIEKLDGMARSEAERHWTEHIPLANAIHVGMNRYVQDRLSPPADGAKPWFGMAHLHFPDEAAMRDGMFTTPEDVSVITADVGEFVQSYATMLAVEHVIKG